MSFESECVLVLLESETTTYFVLLAQVTNTLLCRSGPRQVFFLFVTETGPGRLNSFYSCFSTVDLENIFIRSHTLFVEKVAGKR